MIGKLLNRAKGREMITSYMIAFSMNGVYQFFVLFMMGPIIPIIHNSLKLPRGYGIRNTVSLLNMRQCLDNLLAVNVGGVKIPVLTLYHHRRSACSSSGSARPSSVRICARSVRIWRSRATRASMSSAPA